jgi:hypothetical protein
MDPLNPELALRLVAYLKAHPERSVFWRSDQRVWIFGDDDGPDADVAEIPEDELSGYLPDAPPRRRPFRTSGP